MKKILFLLGLFIVFQCTGLCVFADESLITAEKSSQTRQISDVVVFSDKVPFGNFGLKDKQGNIIVKPQYKKMIRLGNSSWIVQKKDRFGIMDCDGKLLVKPKYRHVDRVFGKYAKLGNDKDYGLYDEKGIAIIEPKYSSIEPLFGKMFLTCRNYKYGIVNEQGEKLLANDFDDIYMPDPHSLRIQYEGEWYQIERMTSNDIELPENVKKVTINDKEFKVTHLVSNTGVFSSYYTLTAADYMLKVFSSISPAYEQTIDDLMFSQGADGVSVFVKLGWLPRFPFTYAKKYYDNFRAPNSGPLSDIRNDLKRQIK